MTTLTTAANDNSKRPVTMISVATLVTFARGAVKVEIPGCPVNVAALKDRAGKTLGFTITTPSGASIGTLGARATYDHLESACARYAAARS